MPKKKIVKLKDVKEVLGGGDKTKVKEKRNTEVTISRSGGRLLREKLGW